MSDRKGVNVPNAVLPVSAITEKDRADLAFALDHGADWIALSFVQRPDDVAEGRKLVAGRAGVMVKLEKPSAIQRLAEIIEQADALMVARGDLGVEMPPEDVPSVQKQVVHACRLAGKPVVVATQMLESMIFSPTPTRAEASDVATAVYDGADAVMLSAETAAGRYPVEAVAMMDRIACRVHDDPLYRTLLEGTRTELEHTAPDAISAAACQVAGMVGAAAIVSYTTLGCDRAARRARAAGGADPGADRETGDGAPPGGLMGRALRAHQRRQKLCRHGAKGSADRASRGVRRTRPARRRHRRGPVRHARRHQRAAHRLGRSLILNGRAPSGASGRAAIAP